MVIATNTHNHNENNQYDETDQTVLYVCYNGAMGGLPRELQTQTGCTQGNGPRLVDVEDYDKIIKQFSFSSKKEKAMKILMKR